MMVTKTMASDRGRGASRAVEQFRSFGLGVVVRKLALRRGPLALLLRAGYRARFSLPVWRYLLNGRSTSLFNSNPPRLTESQKIVLDGLRRDGIAMASLNVLCDKSTMQKLQIKAQSILGSREVLEQIELRRGAVGPKDFLIRAYGERPMLDLGDPFVQFALSDSVLAVVNSYFGMCARLESVDLWYTIPADNGAPAVSSQRWHRDYDDRQLVKVFVYVVDVDANMGALEYIPGSHQFGPYANLFPQRPPEGSYPPIGAVESAVGASAVKSCVGPAGTVVLADTTGLHRGGRSVRGARILFYASYTTNGAIEGAHYAVPPSVGSLISSTWGRYALRRE